MTTSPLNVGFLGAGKMATALGRGFVSAGLTTAELLIASDPYPAARDHFSEVTGGRTTTDNQQVLSEAEIIFLAVKPQHMAGLLAEIRPACEKRHLLVSIAAGISLNALALGVGPHLRLVRVMPNTPCLVGAGAAGLAIGGEATPDDAALVRRLLGSVGLALEVPEPLLDAVTGLSGSGPAYAFLMIEALSDGGVRMGLPRPVATQLAAQTLLGAAKLLLETGEHPGALKDAVSSPGGTTIAGLHALERSGLRAALMNAVEAATLRARELGEG